MLKLGSAPRTAAGPTYVIAIVTASCRLQFALRVSVCAGRQRLCCVSFGT